MRPVLRLVLVAACILGLGAGAHRLWPTLALPAAKSTTSNFAAPTVSPPGPRPPTSLWSPTIQIHTPQIKLFGVVDAHGPGRRSGADAKSLGITLDRVEFTYGEPVPSMDAKVALDASHGLTPLPLLSQYGAVSGFDLAGWQGWTSTVIARYGPGGSFWSGRPDRQYAPVFFELLNEPFGHWFYPTPEPAAYARFFATVVTAAQTANPSVRFLLAAYPRTFRDAAGVWSGQSWDRLLAASPDGARALRLASGVTSHAYGPYEGDAGPDLTVAVHNDFPTLPVWITEIGYRVGETVVDGRTPVRVTETVQAQRMRQSLMDFMSRPWAWAYVWFKWADYGEDKMWGVVRADRSHRPAFRTYQTFITASHP